MKEAEKEAAEATVKKTDTKAVTSSVTGETTEKATSCDGGLPAPTNSTVDASAAPCAACANKRARDAKE